MERLPGKPVGIQVGQRGTGTIPDRNDFTLRTHLDAHLRFADLVLQDTDSRAKLLDRVGLGGSVDFQAARKASAPQRMKAIGTGVPRVPGKVERASSSPILMPTTSVAENVASAAGPGWTGRLHLQRSR